MPYPTAGHIALLRSRERTYSRVYLGVQRGKERTDSPPPLLVGQHYALVAADAYSAAEHTLTFNVANFLLNTDIRSGMTLAVGTLADPFLYGSARIRTVDIANNRMCLERNNLNALGYIAAGNYIWIDGVYRLYRKLPYIVAGVIYEDGNSDTALAAGGIPGYGIAWNANYYDRPVSLMGSPRFAWTGEAISFYGWRSYARGGRALQNWTWDFDGGICVEPGIGFPGSPSGPIRARWDAAGEYIASLVVEDDSGNAGVDAYGIQFNRHRAVRPVLVYDRPGEGSTPPYTDFEVESLSGRYGSGWSCRITVHGTADKSAFPDNALIILYAEDWYAGTRRSLGGWYGQEGILFVGHIRADSVAVDSEKSTVTFEAQTIDEWMSNIDVWPANFLDPAAAAAAWREFDDMVVEDVLWHLSEMSSNLKDVADCFFISNITGEKQVHFLDLTEGSLYDQISSQVGSCFFGQLSASRQGSVHLFKHKNMMTIAERIAYGAPLFTFTTQDWRDELEVGEERMRDGVAQVDFIGFIYDAGGNPQEVYSLAPLRQLNFGMIEKVTGTLLTGQTIAAAQAENDTLSGLYLAWKNIRFPHIRVPAWNNRVLEPATQDYFAVDLAVADTIRGYDWNGKEFLVTGMSIDIDNEGGIILADIEGEASTWGPDGVAGDYPPGGLPDPPDPGGGGGPPGYWPEPPEEGPGEPGDGGLLYFVDGTSGRVFRTRNARDVAANVIYEDLGVIDANGIIYITLDSWDPKNVAMACGDGGIWRTTNLDDAIPTWTQVVDGAPTGGGAYNHDFKQIASSINRRDRWMAVSRFWNNDQGDWFCFVWWSDDGGDTWTNLGLDHWGQNCGLRPTIETSSHDADTAWVVWRRGGDEAMTITTDCWASYTSNTILGIDGSVYPCGYHRYLNNPADLYALWGGKKGTAPNEAQVVWCSADHLTCGFYPLSVGTAGDTRWVGGYTWGTNRYWALSYTTAWEFHVSDNATTWTLQFTFAGGSRFISGWPYDGEQFYATQDGAVAPILISDDRGVTWQEQTGNWAALGYNGNIFCCVPIWVA